MNEYEAQRQATIARNRAKLAELGLATAAQDLIDAAKPEKKPRESREPRDKAAPREATRRSARQGGHGPQELSEHEAAVAKLLIDGVCPKCGRVVTVGGRKHLANCKGRPTDRKVSNASTSEDKSSNEECVTELIRTKIGDQNSKLKELELSGLMSRTKDAATFAVRGSQGKNYNVVFSEGGRSCQCMDYRLRRRDCKHIRLVAHQLGVQEAGCRDWQKAVDRMMASGFAREAASAVGESKGRRISRE